MKQEIQIRDKWIGENHPLFIIVEAGVTCNYDMKITKQLIDVAKDSGADAIKFIFWFPEDLMSNTDRQYTYQTTSGPVTVNQFEMLNELRFTLDEWKEIKKYADDKGIILFSTVSTMSGVDYAEKIGLEAYKLSSWDYTFHSFYKHIAALKKPMIIDTGPVTTLEVARVMDIIKSQGNDQTVLVHCYHTDNYDEINMRAIPYMKQAFNSLVGFSSIDQCADMDIVAVALGAQVLEKRVTVSRDLPGHHHILSMEPKEFSEYVQKMRNVHAALGRYDLIPSQEDLEKRKLAFRSIVANKDIVKGTRLTSKMLEGKRPETGISPEHLDFFLGRTLKRDLKYNELINWDDV